MSALTEPRPESVAASSDGPADLHGVSRFLEHEVSAQELAALMEESRQRGVGLLSLAREKMQERSLR